MRRIPPGSRGWGSPCPRRERARLGLLFGACLALSASDVWAAELAYVANLRAASVQIVDLATNQVTGRVSVGADPNGLAVSPDGREVWVSNFASDSVSVIDVATRNVVVTIPVDAGPVGVAFRPDGSEVYVANKTASSLSVIDSQVRAVVSTILLTPGSGPNSIAFTNDGSALYVTNSTGHSVSIVDPVSRQVGAAIEVGRSPSRIVVDTTRPRAYVANFRSTDLSIIDTDQQLVLNTVPLSVGATGLALTADGGRLYAVGGLALVVDTETRVVTDPIPGVSAATAIALAGQRAYIASLDNASLTVLDPSANTPISTGCIDAGPFAITIAAVAEDRPLAWITEPLSGSKLAAGDRTTVRGTVRGGNGPARSWRLALEKPGAVVEIASGSGDVADGGVLGELQGEWLAPGAPQQLHLQVEAADGALLDSRSSVLAPDPALALVPVDSGSFTRFPLPEIEVDGAGRQVLYVQPTFYCVNPMLLEIESGVRRDVGQCSLGYVLSADGSTVVYSTGEINFADLATGDTSVSINLSAQTLDASRNGKRITFIRQAVSDDVGDYRYQYFYYDHPGRELRQLTTQSGVINMREDDDAYVPVISGNGERIAFVSRLDIADASPSEDQAWRIYAYEVSTHVLRYVTRLAVGQRFSLPSISDDGRWLGFVTSRPERSNLSIGAILDLDSGALQFPIDDLLPFETFDAVITADGSGVVVSTTADLDSSIGNPDHNAELFLYDRETGGFRQLTQTTGAAPASYAPSVADAGQAAAFVFGNSTQACPAAGPQRDDVSGFYLGRAFTVSRRAGNRPPELDPIADQRVPNFEYLELNVSAQDPDEDPVILFLQLFGGTNTPGAEAQFIDAGDGTGEFIWYTHPEEIGEYRMRLGAFDTAGGVTVREFTIEVCGALAPDGSCAATPTPSPSPSVTDTATVTPTQTSTSTPTATPTRTSPQTPTGTVKPTATASATTEPSATSPPTATPSMGAPTATATSVSVQGGGCQVGSSRRVSSWGLVPGFALLALAILRQRNLVYDA